MSGDQKPSDEALRAARDWYLDSSTASKVRTLGVGAFRYYSVCLILTLNVSRAHRGPARARIELMGRRPTNGLSTLNNIFTPTLGRREVRIVGEIRECAACYDVTFFMSF